MFISRETSNAAPDRYSASVRRTERPMALSLATLEFPLPELRNPDIAAARKKRPNALQGQIGLLSHAISTSTRSGLGTSYIEAARQVLSRRSRFQLRLLPVVHLYPSTIHRFCRQLGMGT